MGQVYFRISKHLGIEPLEVIRRKFEPSIRFLIMCYSNEIRQEIKQAKEIEEKLKQQNKY